MSAPSTLVTMAPELLLSIAEHLPLHDLQALIRCNRLLYHLLLRILYQRAVAAILEFNRDPFYNSYGRNGRPWLGNARQVTLCLAAGLDVNAIVYFHWTYTRLHIAAGRWGNNDTWEEEEEVMRLLLAHGADVNAVAVGGQSPLHVAIVHSDRSEILALLLDHGADVNKTDEKGMSPLHCAMRRHKKHPDLPGVVVLLLDHGADVNKVNWKGRCPLHYAVKYAPEQTRLLLERGADPNKVDGGLETPLHYALRCGVWEPEVAVLLLEHGADANLADGNGYSPLHYAVKRPCCRMVACLLKHGADPNLWKGRSPLQDALLGLKTDKSDDERRDTKRALFESVRLLMKAGALVEMLGETDQDLVKTICERRTEHHHLAAPKIVHRKRHDRSGSTAPDIRTYP
jgi:ankyrin repeat protein